MKIDSKVLGGVLLVSGTTIGAAMLALPVSTGMAGFWPAQLLMLVYWVYMTYTAFLILEVNLWIEGTPNMITLAGRTLGMGGKLLAWASYLFLLYSLTTAYLAASSGVFVEFLHRVFALEVPTYVGLFPLLAVFSFFVFRGTASVDHINRALMLGMAAAFVVMLVFLTPHVDPDLLMHFDWKFTFVGLSVVATSFGFHIIIPTLCTYLERDVDKLKKVIWIGSVIPVVIYTLWQLLTLGIIPVAGANGLREGFIHGTDGATLLTRTLASPTLCVVARVFGFLAVMTSFLGVSLSLWDCLADGFRIRNRGRGRLMLYAMTFLPPLFIALSGPRIFLSALEYAGAFGVVILLGLLPVGMVWWGRYRSDLSKHHALRVPGGKAALMAVAIISLLVIVVEVLNKTGVIKTWLF